MWDTITHEIHRRLHEIRDLAQRIEDVPNFGPDIWTMRKLDEDARQVQQHALWISEQLRLPDCPGHHWMVREIRERIRHIYSLAREIEDVPNFGADLWTMREVDEKCRHIKADSSRVEEGVFAILETGHGPGHVH